MSKKWNGYEILIGILQYNKTIQEVLEINNKLFL